MIVELMLKALINILINKSIITKEQIDEEYKKLWIERRNRGI